MSVGYDLLMIAMVASLVWTLSRLFRAAPTDRSPMTPPDPAHDVVEPPCALLDPKPDNHGHLTCHRCEQLTKPWWIIADLCTSPEGLESRADAIITYGNALPDGVTTEASADSALLRRKATELQIQTTDETQPAATGVSRARGGGLRLGEEETWAGLSVNWGCTTFGCEWGFSAGGQGDERDMPREWDFCPKCGGGLREITRRILA